VFISTSFKGGAMDCPEHSIQIQERLIGDLRLVIENAEELLRSTGQYTTPNYRSARIKLTLALNAATQELIRFEDARLSRMIEATHAASQRFNDQTGEARVLRAFELAPPLV
jgi:ElaB/YqjD/DUF883 family membrane-anchored ribosome-binding protein